MGLAHELLGPTEGKPFTTFINMLNDFLLQKNFYQLLPIFTHKFLKMYIFYYTSLKFSELQIVLNFIGLN